MSQNIPRFVLDPLPADDPAIAVALAALEDTRRRTLETVAGLGPEALDAPPPAGANTVGTLLYHIAGADMFRLYSGILDQPPPPDVAALFPGPPRDAQGVLIPLRGQGLDSYLERLQFVRGKLLAVYRQMTADEYRQVRRRSGPRGPYEITAE